MKQELNTNFKDYLEAKKKARKRGVLKRPQGKYLNPNCVMGYEWAKFIYLTGEGGVGKSYSILNWLLGRKYKKPDKVHLYIMRLSDTQVGEMLRDDAKTLIDPDLYRKYKKDLKPRGKTVYFGHYDERTTKSGKIQRRFIREGELCRVASLATCFNDKGQGIYDNQMDDSHEIYFYCDEVVRDEAGGEMNRFSIVENFTNQLESFGRTFHGTIKVFFMSNLVGSAEILAHWNFIPREPGIYPLKRKLAVVYNIKASEQFNEEERKTSIGYLFNKDSRRYANTIQSDGALVAPKAKVREAKENFVIAFDKNKNKWYTIKNGNIICKYNGENKTVFAMAEFIDQIYDKKVIDQLIGMYRARILLFDNVTTYVTFTDELSRLKKR